MTIESFNAAVKKYNNEKQVHEAFAELQVLYMNVCIYVCMHIYMIHASYNY